MAVVRNVSFSYHKNNVDSADDALRSLQEQNVTKNSNGAAVGT